MTIKINVELDLPSKKVIDKHLKAAPRVRKAIGQGLKQNLDETAQYLKKEKLSGSYKPFQVKAGKGPLAVRSGALRQSVDGKFDQPPFSGFIGVGGNTPATKYARMQLGDGTTIIRPVKANHIWIPIMDNLTKGGQVRLTPREAMSIKNKRGARLLRIFKSKRGNLIAAIDGSHVPNVRKKGKLSPLFVLKKQVEVKGTNAIFEAVEERQERMNTVLRNHIITAMEGQA